MKTHTTEYRRNSPASFVQKAKGQQLEQQINNTSAAVTQPRDGFHPSSRLRDA
ncbi:MAG: hypothetical protein IJR99_16795 [Kiritimatiellae bacterium]|nr:hypothetical protein [Kiritimatiellia bacterium]